MTHRNLAWWTGHIALPMAVILTFALWVGTASAKVSLEQTVSIDICAQPPLQLPENPGDEIPEARTRTSKMRWLGGNRYSIDSTLASQHYFNSTTNAWEDIDTAISVSPRANWDWEMTINSWQLLIRDDTTVAFGKGNHWIGFRYVGFAYLDWATKDYVILQERQPVTPVVANNTITWPNIFLDIDLVYECEPDRFKERLEIGQQARDWLTANPPSSFGLSNPSTYLCGYLEMDWRNAFPARIGNVTINWDVANAFINERVTFHHPVLDDIVAALPLDFAHVPDADSDLLRVREYFWKGLGNDEHYLLFGANVLVLNTLPEGTIVIDPTIDAAIGGSAYDGGYWDSWGTTGIRHRIGQWYGVRDSFFTFQNITIPAGSDIDSNTYFAPWNYLNTTGVVTNVYAEDADNPAAPTSEADHDGRSRTTAFAAWDEPQADGENEQSPSLEGVIQELVDSYTISGDNITILWDDDGSLGSETRVQWYSYDLGSGYAADLHIEYTAGAACSPDIANTPSSHGFGTVNTNTTYWSNGSAPAFPIDAANCTFNVTNSSGGSVNITIRADNWTGGVNWTLAASPGADEVMVLAGELGDNEGDFLTLTGSDQHFITSLADDASQEWELKLETPTSFSDGNLKTTTVTLTATCE